MGRSASREGESAVGRVIADRYELLGLIGAGAAARVYLARDNHLGRDVAVKMLLEDAAADPDFAERFRREAKAIASFSHPNIVTIFDWGTADGLDYMVMEYVQGGSLSELLAERGHLSEYHALRLAAGTAKALAAAHARGIVHRDIKPDNILLTLDGSPKVADFGIAWVPGLSHLTLTNAIFGTVSYISPEQARGEGVDGRSDLYSLGVVLYRMLTGRLPFEGGSMVDVAVRHVQEQPRSPAAIRPEISRPTERIVLKAMAKRPSDRYQNATAMAGALEEARANLDARPVRPRRARSESTVAAPLGIVRESVPRRPIESPSLHRGSSPWARLLWAVPAGLLALVAIAIALAAHPWMGSTAHHPAASGRVPAATPARTTAPKSTPSGNRPGRSTSNPTPTSAPPTSAPPTSKPVVAPPAHRPAKTHPTAPVASSAPEPPPPGASGPPASAAGSSGGPSPITGASSPQAAVIAFYTDISRGRFADAAGLWSPTLQQNDPPAVYIDQRFANTRGIWVSGVTLQSMDASSGTATVSVHVTEAVGSSGATNAFDGSWQLVQQNGRWLLNSPNLREASSAAMIVPGFEPAVTGSHGDAGRGNGGGNGDGKAKGHGKHGD